MPRRKKEMAGVEAATTGDILDPWPRARNTLLDENNPTNRKSPPATPPRVPRREYATLTGLAPYTPTSTFPGNANPHLLGGLVPSLFAPGKFPFITTLCF